MSWTPEEPMPKRRRFADEQHAAVQDPDYSSDTKYCRPWYPESHISPSLGPSSWTTLPGQMTGFQFQQGTQAASWLPPVGILQESSGEYNVPQLYERGKNTGGQSNRVQMPYLAPKHVPHHDHVWHNPASILPMPHCYYPQGVATIPNQNSPFATMETDMATIPFNTASTIPRESPSAGLAFDYVPSNGMTDPGPGATDSSMEETVCFGMVG